MSNNIKYDAAGNLWMFESTEENLVKLGFTSTFLRQSFGECWHILPNFDNIKEGDVLLTVETNDGLIPIKSPYAGKVSYFNTKALNFPEKLVDTDHIVTILKVKPPAKSRKDYVEEPKKKIDRVRIDDPFAGLVQAAPRRQDNTPAALAERVWREALQQRAHADTEPLNWPHANDVQAPAAQDRATRNRTAAIRGRTAGRG